MKYSENYDFALPTAEDDTLADIGVISENFKTVDRVMKKNENLEVELNKFEGETMDAVGRLSAKDADLQSQINMLSGVDMSEFQAQLDNKSDATNLVNGSAEGSLRGIGTKEEDGTYTMGWRAFAEGNETTASGDCSHAEGNNNTASGAGSHAEGAGNCVASGAGSHAEGSWATASGAYSHAEGSGTKAYGEASHAEGKSTTAYSETSHAEGHSTTASNSCSHAEGYLTKASGKNSHAEGSRVESSGENSHAEGSGTTAKGENSHAEGSGTIAGSYRQHVQGRYNIADNDNKYSHIVGNGSSDEDRSNAHTLDWDGNAWYAGDVIVGGTSQDDENAINLVNISTKNKTDIEGLKAKDTDLQSQIDALGSVDVSEFQSQLDTLQTNVNGLQMQVGPIYGDMSDWTGNDTVYQAVTKLKAKDEDLQSQLNTKATREVAIVGSDNENSAGWYKVADGTMPALNDVSMLFAVHSTVTNKQYAGILQLNLRSATSNITCPQFGWLVRNGFEDGQVIVTTNGLSWAMYFKVTTPRYYRTFFEVLQKSDRINPALKNYNLYTNSTVETTAPTATFASTDLGSVHQTIADLTARIEALEKNSSGGSGGVSQAVLIDWDVNTNGATQGTVIKDANGLHASGDKSLRIANYWKCDASAYDGITFTAYGSGKLRVEVGGVEGEYKTLGTTPTTYTIAFADIGLTELSGIEINLQTQGAYDLTVSDIYGYTKS